MANNSGGVFSSSPSASTPMQFSSLLEANTYRVKAIVERLTFITHSKGGSIRFDSSEFFNLCIALARGVDYALTINDVPAVAHRLPPLIKQVYQRRNESYLQPALMVLMISVKNACKSGWFMTADADELIKMTNEFFSIFCMTVSVNPIVGNALGIISTLVSRFYPQLKFCSLLDSSEAKPGYEILMSDFQIPRNIPPEEKIMLIVAQTDNLETSSCIISPSQASFLVNGKAVDRRTNVSLSLQDNGGPQFPTDITKMLKFGLNIIQTVGLFTGSYLIALAFMSKITLPKSPMLKDYVHPVVAAVGADSEIIEGASRITLNCPISFRRIRTPVKGHLCRHHQCFDYDNYVEMNSWKPSWRCPLCNQSVSFVDLRIDQNMVKILKDVGEDVIDIVISADESWKVVSEDNETKDKQHKEDLLGQPDCNIDNKSVNTATDAVDLTMDDDEKSDSAVSFGQAGPPNNFISQRENHVVETVDRKPFNDSGNLASSSGNAMWSNIWSSLSGSSALDASASETLESLLPGALASPVVTDAVSPSLIPESHAIVEPSQPILSGHQISQVRTLAEIMQARQLRNSMSDYETERSPIPRHIHRTPIAVQALPVQSQQAQAPSSFKRMRINGPNSCSLSNDAPLVTYETVQPVTMASNGLTMTSGGNNMQHSLGASAPSISQQIQTPNLQHVISLPASNLMGARIPSNVQRVAGAYRQPSSNNLPSVVSPLNFRHPSAGLLMSGASRSNTSALPVGVARELARQVTQQIGQAQARAATPQSSRIPEPGPSIVGSSRLSVGEPSRNVAEVQPNWRPTGRMRGSLTGNAYSAALSQYATPTNLVRPGRVPESSALPLTADQLPSISSNVNAQGPV